MPPVGPLKTSKKPKVRVTQTQARHAAAGKLKAPPKTDVQSSGGDYGTRQAEGYKTKQAIRAIPKPGKPLKRTKGPGALGVASSTYAATVFPAVAGALAAVDKATGSKTLDFAKKTAGNIPKDAAELAVTTPTSVAKLATTAVHHPTKVPGLLVAPYKELYHHPGSFISTHPVTTALMVAPVGRVPGRAAGKVARVTGKQTLERPAATLPHTSLKEPRTGSRDFVVRKAQAREDAKNPNPKVTVRQVQKRVDESFGAQQKHRGRVEQRIQEKAAAHAKTLPKDERAAYLAEQKAGARSAGKDTAAREYGREFGSTWRVGSTTHPSAPAPGTPEFKAVVDRYEKVQGLRDRPGTPGEGGAASAAGRRILGGAHLEATPEGIQPRITGKVILKPKDATQGHLHDTRAEADAVAAALNRKPVNLTRGGFTKAEKLLPLAKQEMPLNWVVRPAGPKFAVVPEFVNKRLSKQEGVGTSRAPGSKVLRQSRSMFTRAVLPYRPTWLTGQATEGPLRMAAMGAGPTSFVRAKKLVAEMERQEPGSGKALLDRAQPAGRIGRVMKEFAGERKTLAEDFSDNPLAHALTQAGKTPGIKQLRDLHHAVSSFVFTRLNGQFLEGLPQTAMLGKALKNSPLMEKHVIGLSDKAIQDAARGARETPAQISLAREVQRAYGKYANFGPGMREAIVHWTPFIPWTLNAVRFLTTVLPKDHPVISALLADAGAAEEDWRKAHHLSFHGPHVPFFMMGGYPIHGGKDMLRLSHYGPSGVAQDPTGGFSGAVLPQFSGMYGALRYGLDWKGKPLRHDDGTPYTDAEKWLYGLAQLGEALTPLASQTHQVIDSKDKLKGARKQLRLMSVTKIKNDQAGLLTQKEIDDLVGPDTGPVLSQKEIDALVGD